jgi:hypothetical protein
MRTISLDLFIVVTIFLSCVIGVMTANNVAYDRHTVLSVQQVHGQTTINYNHQTIDIPTERFSGFTAEQIQDGLLVEFIIN